MLSFKKSLFSFSVLLLFLLPSPNLFALELKSRHFDIQIHKDTNSYELLKKLKIGYSLHPDAATFKDSSNVENMLENILDEIYLEVSDILDIHMYSFRIKLEVLPDKGYLNRILQERLRKEISVPSFYFYEGNTIYISAEEINPGMLGHEVAHAIISHYFVAPPPMKVQEVLCGYVEYSLIKSTK